MDKEFLNNSLLSFPKSSDFHSFYKSLDIYKEWKISTGKMNSRGHIIRSKHYSLQLQELFRSKNMFRRNVSVAEIVSWLDGYKIVERLLIKLHDDLPNYTFNQVEIYSEYMIRMSKKMRIDYILKYKEKILLIELRMVSNFDKIRPTWEKKKMELIIYKDLLENYLTDNIKIYNYALITLPEYDIRKKIQKHIDYNINQINHLKEYIIEFLIGQL